MSTRIESSVTNSLNPDKPFSWGLFRVETESETIQHVALNKTLQKAGRLERWRVIRLETNDNEIVGQGLWDIETTLRLLKNVKKEGRKYQLPSDEYLFNYDKLNEFIFYSCKVKKEISQILKRSSILTPIKNTQDVYRLNGFLISYVIENLVFNGDMFRCRVKFQEIEDNPDKLWFVMRIQKGSALQQL